jgi:DNA-binding response OmpR family regulator
MIHRVLVVDDDPWMHRLIAAFLRDLPLEIDSASDGTIAMAKALTSRPDLIISDVMMPGMDGWSLVRKLRSHAELAFIPFIFLTSLSSTADVLRGFRLGADDFLSKPFKGPELSERVQAALKSRGAAEETARATIDDRRGRGLQGTLKDVGLSSLLVLLEMERKTGLLVLTRSEPAERCRLFIREGRVVSASSDADRGLVHALAVYHALYWSDGTFSFTSVAVEMPDQVQMTTTHLLMEGAQRIDEALRPTFTTEVHIEE